jgi:glycerol-3-phosphate acyltransferase PlsY
MDAVMFILILLAAALPAYILGSVNGAIITSKYLFRKDIRQYGSGNPGITNFYRVFGKVGALLVLAIDISKSVLPTIFGGFLFDTFFDMMIFGRVATGLFVMLGHCFPAYYGFKGGKGVMAVGSFIFVVDWRAALVCWAVFILVVLLTRYISLGSIVAALAFPAAIIIFRLGGPWEVIFAAMCTILLIVRHRSNIKRLKEGTESRFSFRGKS